MNATILYIQSRNLVGRLLRLALLVPFIWAQEPDPEILAAIAAIRNVLLLYITPLAGLVMLGVLVWAGWTWMTAGPNQSQVKKAKDILKNGGIGAGIFLGAVVLADIVISVIEQVWKEGGGGGG